MRKTRAERDEEILNFCKQYMSEHGYPPSYREIGDACGMKSTSTVNNNMFRLRMEGKINSEAPFRSSRAFRLKGSRYVFDDDEK